MVFARVSSQEASSKPSRELVYIWELSRFLLQMYYCSEGLDLLRCNDEVRENESCNRGLKKFIRNDEPSWEIGKLVGIGIAVECNETGLSVRLRVREAAGGPVVYSIDPTQWGDGKGDPEVFILAHWLTYIYNLQALTKDLWDKLYPIMFLLSHDYITKCNKEIKVNELLEKYFSSQEQKWMIPDFDIEYSRGGFDKQQKLYEKVEKTLEKLRKYECSIINYMAEALEEAKKCFRGNNEGKQDKGIDELWVQALAYALYKLTYGHKDKSNNKSNNQSNNKSNNKSKIFSCDNDNDFKELCKYINKENEEYREHKRLWSALKDYILTPKYTEIILYKLEKLGKDNSNKNRILYNKIKNIRDAMCRCCLSVWTSDFIEQFELPGDKWNREFLKTLIGSLKLKDNARTLYDKYKGYLKERKLYPITTSTQ